MFINKHPTIANQQADLVPGLYQGCAALYADESSNRIVLMAEYRLSNQRSISAIELIRYNGIGSIEYESFVRHTNGLWRNNHGEVNSLSHFLPEDIENFRVFKNMRLAPQLIMATPNEGPSVYLH